MRNPARITTISILLVLSALPAPCAAAALESPGPAWRSLPVLFTPNKGQVSQAYDFVAKAAAVEIWIAPQHAAIHAEGQRVILEFEGAAYGRVEPAGQNSGVANYLRGGEGGKAIANVPVYRGLRIRELYPGIDMEYGSTGRRLKSNFLVAPGKDPSVIRLRYHDADSVRIDADGSLVLTTRSGELRESPPEAFQETARGRVRVRASFRLLTPDTAGFDLGQYDRSLPLLIDPVLVYSTLVGGQRMDSAQSIAIDTSGNAYLAGWTESVGFPTSNPIQGTHRGSVDAFVFKLNGSTLVYATFLGGAGDDRATSIAVDAANSVFLAGTTTSTDFPVQSAAQATNRGGKDGFVARLNATGSALLFSSYLGGSGSDHVAALALDPAGNAYLTGDTTSTDFPTLSPYKASLGGPQDAFLTKFSPSGTIVYSTYYGGLGTERGLAIAVDSSGRAHFAGTTDSVDFPVSSGVVQPARGPGFEGFVVKFEANGTTRSFATFIGGSGGTVSQPEAVNGVALDTSGNIYVAGVTPSANYPIAGTPVQAVNGGGSTDAFVTKLNPGATVRFYSTYLGGSSSDAATAIRVDSTGAAYVAGYTASPNFPTAAPLQFTNAGSYDAFVVKLSSAGALTFGTYLGGASADAAHGLAADNNGKVYVAGQTQSSDYPIQSAYQWTLRGAVEGFVTKIDTAANAAAPQAHWINPSSGTGGTQTFSFQVSIASGYQNIAAVFGVFVGNDQRRCYFQFHPATSRVWLQQDNQLNWVGPITIPGSGSISTSTCTIQAAGSSHTPSGATSTFSLPITFSPTFSGFKWFHMLAQDVSYILHSGWQFLGTWTVP